MKSNYNYSVNLGEFAKRKPIYLDALTDYEIAYLLGVYIGDGNSYEGFDQTSIDYDFVDHVAQLLNKLCRLDIKPKKYIRRRKEKRDEIGYRIRVNRRELKDWLENQTNNKKKIPLFKTTKEIYWFFSGFFDSEGTIKYSGHINKDGGKSCTYLDLTQKNKKILEQLKLLLNRLEIYCNIKSERGYFHLSIWNKKNFSKILTNGNICIERKRKKIEDYANYRYVRTEEHIKNLMKSRRDK